MSMLASTGSDTFILMLCQMEYNSTVDRRQYWELSSWLGDLTNTSDYPDSDAMKLYEVAFLDHEHPQHTIAIKLDLYRKSLTDLLSVAAAQLTTLYKDYPRYSRLALVRRLSKRFIGWYPVDPMRVAALDSIDSQQRLKPVVVHHAKLPGKKIPKGKATEDDLAKALKEKQRKKALEKRKQQAKKDMHAPESCGQLEPLSKYSKLETTMAPGNSGEQSFETTGPPIDRKPPSEETPVGPP